MEGWREKQKEGWAEEMDGDDEGMDGGRRKDGLVSFIAYIYHHSCGTLYHLCVRLDTSL